MCGIAGIYNLEKNTVEASVLKAMSDALSHRGPDDAGEILLDNGRLGLAHRRLSIIDLSLAGHQPMSNEDNSLWIICNGEIYNYLELKEELIVKGHVFKSNTDTEVILHSYEEEGVACLRKFVGMWGFALWDNRKKVLFCARDRIGKKPFYYFHNHDFFIFASEIKALLKNPAVSSAPNDKTIFRYLYQGILRDLYNQFFYVDASEETFFAQVKQLLPGHYLTLKEGRLEIRKYWSLNFKDKIFHKDDWKYIEEFKSIFENAVKIRLRGDVPLGVYLSGGLDSSSVACMVKRLLPDQKIKAFTTYFEGTKYDERNYARLVAKDTDFDWESMAPSRQGIFADMENIVRSMDQPFTELSIYPQWAVMRQAKVSGIRIMLNGHGGDEILGGYPTNFPYYFADLIKGGHLCLFWKEAGIHAQRYNTSRYADAMQAGRVMLSNAIPGSLKNRLKNMTLKHTDILQRDFLMENISGMPVMPDAQTLDFMDINFSITMAFYPLPFWLHSEDRVSMNFSVESRSPFLDHRLVEYCARLPCRQKIRNGFTKYLLRESLKGVLPQEIRNRTDKLGFTGPVQQWLTKDNKFIKDILQSESFSRREYFNHKKVLSHYDDFCSGKKGNFFFSVVWSWINLELWMREFVDK